MDPRDEILQAYEHWQTAHERFPCQLRLPLRLQCELLKLPNGGDQVFLDRLRSMGIEVIPTAYHDPITFE